MAVRYSVRETFPAMTGGPRVLGVLLDGTTPDGVTLLLEATGAPIRAPSFDRHTRSTEEELRMGLLLHPEDALTPGSTLVSPPEA